MNKNGRVQGCLHSANLLRFLAPLFGVRVADIEVVFGRESVNKQLRIRSPKRLPAVLAVAIAAAEVEL